jgi:hypothetical protein
MSTAVVGNLKKVFFDMLGIKQPGSWARVVLLVLINDKSINGKEEPRSSNQMINETLEYSFRKKQLTI